MRCVCQASSKQPHLSIADSPPLQAPNPRLAPSLLIFKAKARIVDQRDRALPHLFGGPRRAFGAGLCSVSEKLFTRYSCKGPCARGEVPMPVIASAAAYHAVTQGKSGPELTPRGEHLDLGDAEQRHLSADGLTITTEEEEEFPNMVFVPIKDTPADVDRRELAIFLIMLGFFLCNLGSQHLCQVAPPCRRCRCGGHDVHRHLRQRQRKRIPYRPRQRVRLLALVTALVPDEHRCP